MSTYTQILYQIVFSTKNREHTLQKDNLETLYKYLWGVLKYKNCFPYQIGGITNHLHIITHIHPSIALADLIKDLKLASSKDIKERKYFPDFTGWQNGYGAFTYSISAKENLITYVKNQEQHHRKLSFKEEFLTLLNENEVEFDEKYLL